MALEEATIAATAEEKADRSRIELNYFEDLATRLAHSQAPVSQESGRKPTLLDRLKIQERLLERAYKEFASASFKESIPPYLPSAFSGAQFLYFG